VIDIKHQWAVGPGSNTVWGGGHSQERDRTSLVHSDINLRNKENKRPVQRTERLRTNWRKEEAYRNLEIFWSNSGMKEIDFKRKR